MTRFAKEAANTMKKEGNRIVDIHSHILYGVDDGAKTLEESLQMLWLAAQEGITHIIATPHFRADRRSANPDRIASNFTELQGAAARQEIPLTLCLGNEIYYCDGTEAALEQGRVRTLNGSSYLLMEFSPQESFVYIRNALDQLAGLGYISILAHVERYGNILSQPESVRQLKEMGVRIQVNAAAIVSGRKLSERKALHRLLKEQLVDFVATDAHGRNDRKPEMQKCCNHLYKKYRQSYVDAILSQNAAEIIGIE